MTLNSSTVRTRNAVAILSLFLFSALILLFAFARQPVSAGSAQSSEGYGRALIIGLQPTNTTALTALSPAALAPDAVQASRPLFQQSGVYHDPLLDAPIAREHIYRLQLAPGADIQAVMFNLRQQPGVAFVEPDYIAHQIAVPDDPRYDEQWGLHKINADDAWDIQTGNGSTIIAVIDAGIDDAHPDLAARLWTNPGETANNGIDDDNNGYIDDVNGWNFYAGNDDLSDSTGHGTQVAGLIAAAGNNNTGVSGVCWNCQIMVLKVIQPGGNANYSDIARAIDYAAAKGAHVINLSLGGNADSAALRAAIAAASSSVLVAGAGNDSNSIPFYPAAYDSVLAVAGTDDADVRVSTSNYGPWVDLSAPGIDVLTTFDGGSYGLADGTSLAAPFASGAAALLHAQFGWSPALIRAHLMQTAAPIAAANPGHENDLGAGRLDAGAALTTPAEPDLAVQTVTVDGRAAGQPEPGTTVDLLLTLTNHWAPTGPLQATLSSHDAYATIAQPSAAFPAIDTNGSSQNSTPLQITVANNAPYAHDLNLRLTLRQNGAVIQTIPVPVTVAQQVINVSGVISTDTTWSGDRVYRLTGNVVVAEGATLTVEAGARIEANSDRLLRVEGALLGTGTADEPVVFTSAATEAMPGDWQGIEIRLLGHLELAFCEVSYADTAIRFNGYHFHHILEKCVISHNNNGMEADGGSMTVRQNQIMHNGSAGHLSTLGAILHDNEIAYNNNGMRAIGSITGNLIHNNQGAGLRVHGANVYSNTIVFNDIGLRLGQNDRYNTFANNNLALNHVYNFQYEGADNITLADFWWGTTDLDAINESIYDFEEDIDLGIVHVDPILTAPSSAAPAYLHDIDVAPDTTIGIQEATIDLKFSAAMDVEQIPEVMLRLEKQIQLPSTWVRDMAVAPDGSLWVTTNNDLMRYDGDQLTTYPASPFAHPYYYSRMDVDKNGDVWIVPETSSDWVLRFDGSEWTEHHITAAVGFSVKDVAADPTSGIWLAHTDRVTHLDGNNTTTFIIEDAVGAIRGIEVAPDGAVWTAVATGYGGPAYMYRFYEDQWTRFSPEGIYIDYFALKAVASDELYLLDAGVLLQFDGTTWTINDSLFPDPREFAFAIEKSADGTILAASDNHLIRYDGSNLLPAPVLPETVTAITEIVETANGALWLGTDNGVNLLYETVLTSGAWLDNTTYRITHPVTAAMPRGSYMIEVSGAIDANGRETPPMTLPAFTVDYAGEVADSTPPPSPYVFASGIQGDATGFTAHWSANDPDSTIIAYRYAVGTTPGGREIISWTTTNNTSVTRNNLVLVPGQSYYVSLQAQNSGGLWSVVTTDSFTAGERDIEITPTAIPPTPTATLPGSTPPPTATLPGSTPPPTATLPGSTLPPTATLPGSTPSPTATPPPGARAEHIYLPALWGR